MEIVLIILALIAYLIAMPIIIISLFCRVNNIEEQIITLKKALSSQDKTTHSPNTKPAAQSDSTEKKTAPSKNIKSNEDTISEQPKPWSKAVEKSALTAKQPIVKDKTTTKEKENNNFELQLGAKLPVWIGSIALILGVFFLVKYSIENSLISPELRLFFGGAFGIALLAASEYARKNTKYQIPLRIRQATAGAGIAILYIIAYSAHSIYGFLGSTTAFLALSSVTVTAIIFSIRSGMPIALMGLLGGFITPMLVESSSPNPIVLFSYLYLLYGALMLIIRMMKWTKLSLPATAGALIWVLLFFTKSSFLIADVIILGLFLTAISITHATLFKSEDDDSKSASSQLNLMLPSIGSLAIFAVLIGQDGIELFEWGMYGLLSLATIGIAFFKPKEYDMAPAMGAVISALILVGWSGAELSHLIIASIVFASIYSISCFYFALRYRISTLAYSALAAITPFTFFIIDFAKYKLDKSIIKGSTGIVKINQHIPTDLLGDRASLLDFRNTMWAATAFILGAVTISIISFVKKLWADNEEMKENIIALFTVAATAFITTGLCISLEKELLAVALALETLALAWLNTRLNTKWLRLLTASIAIGFTIVVLNQLTFLLVLAIKSVFGYSGSYSIPFSRIPIIQSGIPALLFALAGLYLYQKKDDVIVKYMETLFIGLITLTAYYTVRHLFHSGAGTALHDPSFIERGITTNVLIAFSIAAYSFGIKYKRTVFSTLGIALTYIGLFRIGWFDIITDNPWKNVSDAGNLVLLNGITLTFGLPIISLLYQAKQLTKNNYPNLPRIIHSSCLILTFATVTFWVRHLFSLSPNFVSYRMGNAEMYGYSVAWLLLGVSLLASGIIKKNTYLRYGSLAVLIVTVGKVFFFDASELDGLLRVSSFFGLGLALIGLSYIYTRFVFKNEK